MKLNNKGFAVTGILYTLLVIFLVLMLSLLVTFSDRKNILIKLKEGIIGESYNGYVYGVKRDINSTNSAWERIEDSVNLVANAMHSSESVQNDFDNIYPWSDIISYNYNTSSNEITAYYGDDNFKFDGSNGEVLTEIPEFYYKREQKEENGSTYEYIYISRTMREGFSKSEKFSIGRYLNSGSSEGIHSISGATPLASTTITNQRAYAKKLGSNFGIMDYRYFIIQILYLVEYADYNPNGIIGNGVTGPVTTGGADSLGMKSGKLDGSIIYRGIEDIYGNLWEQVDGINIDADSNIYINYNPATYQNDVFDGDYQLLGYKMVSTNGYASKVGYDATNPLIFLPTEVTSSVVNINDRVYGSSSATNRFPIYGDWGPPAGFLSWSIQRNVGGAATCDGARLLRYNY